MTAVPGPARGVGGLLVLGLGNDLMTDDAVGLHVARAVRARLAPGDPAEVRESAKMGFALLDDVAGFAMALLVDAVQTGTAPAGHVHMLDAANVRSLPVVSPHFAGVGEMLALGRRLDMAMPAEVRVAAIEVADPYTFSTNLSGTMRARMDGVVERVWEEVRSALEALQTRRGAAAHA